MKQAVILAAGEGQRLRPFTVNRPKAMLAIADKPVLQYVVEALAANGIRDIVLVVGYRQEQVMDYMGSGQEFGVEITYITQKKQLGTAHALAQAREAAAAEFLVLPGDNLIEAATIAEFAAMKPSAMLVKRVENPARYGVVTAKGGVLTGIVEKPEEAANNLVSTGIYSFTREIFDFIEPVLDLPDVVNGMIEKGHAIKVCETESTWLDAAYPWDILTLNGAVLRQTRAYTGGTIEKGANIQGEVAVGKDTIIRANSYITGPVVIGEGCDIGPYACILPSTTIGNNVVISSFTEVKNSVIGSDVNIGPGGIIQDSVIDKGCIIKGNFTACSSQAEIRVQDECHLINVGTMLGEGCNLGNNVVAQPGVIAGNYCQVQAMRLISGDLPDRSLLL